MRAEERSQILALTQAWTQKYQNTRWPSTHRARLKITSSSDWTFTRLRSGGTWLRPTNVAVSDQATYAGFAGELLKLTQTLENAEAGESVEMNEDILFVNLNEEGVLEFEIGCSHVGTTQVEILNSLSGQPVRVDTFWWGGINPGAENLLQVALPVEAISQRLP